MEPLFLLSALLAEIIGTMAGFGSSTVLLPIATFFFDFRTALVVVAFFHIFGNISRVSFFRYGINWRLVIVFGIPSVLLTFIGARLVATTPSSVLKSFLGGFLFLYAVWQWRREVRLPAKTTMALLGGGLSGFLAGLIGTGGALRGAFLTSFGLMKEQYIATAALIALAVDLTRLPVYLKNGYFQAVSWWYVPLLFLLALAGSWIGKKIVDRIPKAMFRKIVLAALGIGGLAFIWQI